MGTDNKLPCHITWTDSCNIRHKIVLNRKSDQLTIAFPCGTEIKWYGQRTDRTGLDAQTRVAEVTFSYVGSDFINNCGIRVAVTGWKSSKTSEDAIDTRRWQKAAEIAAKTTGALKNMAE